MLTWKEEYLKKNNFHQNLIKLFKYGFWFVDVGYFSADAYTFLW